MNDLLINVMPKTLLKVLRPTILLWFQTDRFCFVLCARQAGNSGDGILQQQQQQRKATFENISDLYNTYTIPFKNMWMVDIYLKRVFYLIKNLVKKNYNLLFSIVLLLYLMIC